MKIQRPLIVLALSGLAGLVAVGLVIRWLQAQTEGASLMVVAARDVPLGTPLEASMLRTMAWPGGSLPDGAVAEPAGLIGRVTRTSLARHEPVLQAKLAAPGARGGLSAAIEPGKRAMTVKVNEVVGVAGFALPGSLVDVMVHTSTDDSQQRSSAAVSKIVLERILVLAVAQEAGRDATAPKVVNAVTLEVSPEQAEKLDLARSVGSLSLVLRNPVDQDPAQTSGAAKADLLEARLAAQAQPTSPQTSPPLRAAAPRALAAHVGNSGQGAATRIEVIRGLSRSHAEF